MVYPFCIFSCQFGTSANIVTSTKIDLRHLLFYKLYARLLVALSHFILHCFLNKYNGKYCYIYGFKKLFTLPMLYLKCSTIFYIHNVYNNNLLAIMTTSQHKKPNLQCFISFHNNANVLDYVNIFSAWCLSHLNDNSCSPCFRLLFCILDC